MPWIRIILYPDCSKLNSILGNFRQAKLSIFRLLESKDPQIGSIDLNSNSWSSAVVGQHVSECVCQVKETGHDIVIGLPTIMRSFKEPSNDHRWNVSYRCWKRIQSFHYWQREDLTSFGTLKIGIFKVLECGDLRRSGWLISIVDSLPLTYLTWWCLLFTMRMTFACPTMKRSL